MLTRINTSEELRNILAQELENIMVTDMHTHLFSSEFGNMLFFGIDEALTYHYLIAEFFRYSQMDYRTFFRLSKMEQADLVWQALFLQRSPVSEAQRGVLTILKKLGLDPSSRSLAEYREYYRSKTVTEQIDTVFKVAGVREVVMTNDPFDPQERQFWNSGVGQGDPRFRAALRIDPLLTDYANAEGILREEGYDVDSNLGGQSLAEVRRFLIDWVDKIDALYMAVSLPPAFTIADNSLSTRLLKECVLPVCREKGIPLALMIGVKRMINPHLQSAGDSVGRADLQAIEELCTEYPDNRFLVTMLSLENQHELAITARKHRNLMVFGCWWFLNNPSIIRDITAMRIETLGLSFIPQHSDARVLEQLIYKWDHSRAVIGEVLQGKYADLLATGWTVTAEQIRGDLKALFQDNFWNFVGR